VFSTRKEFSALQIFGLDRPCSDRLFAMSHVTLLKGVLEKEEVLCLRVALGLHKCCSVLHKCCSVLQCVAVYCSVLQCAAVCCSMVHCVSVCFSVLQCVAVCHDPYCCVTSAIRGGLHVRCNVLLWCSVLQCGIVC